MSSHPLLESAEHHLRSFCSVQPNRRTGSPGNREATGYFEQVVRSLGFVPESAEIPCLDWSCRGCSLTGAGIEYPIEASPYSIGCDIDAPLVTAATREELESRDCSNRILLLTGALTAEQLMPKNFTFYNPDHHRKLYELLERKRPQAIIAATRRNPESAGALYPFPFINDGDLTIPCAHCTEETGARIAPGGDASFRLTIDAERRESSASNVIIRTDHGTPMRTVVTAHIDAYENTPGATDNAAGTVVLLLLAELLAAGHRGGAVEIAALNGEDHYSAAGQKDYLSRYGDTMKNTRLVINIDGAGYRAGATAYSFYDCPTDIREAAVSSFTGFGGLIEGPQWFAGDHSIFLQHGVPAIAVTSERVAELVSRIAHTPEDRPEIVDCRKLVEIAEALAELLSKLG